MAIAIMRGSLRGLWATSKNTRELDAQEMLHQTLLRLLRFSKPVHFPSLLTLLTQLVEVEGDEKKGPNKISDKSYQSFFDILLSYKAFRDRVKSDLDEERHLKNLSICADDSLKSFYENSEIKPRIIWYQCPGEKDDMEKVRVQLQEFIESAARLQKKGDVLLLGLVKGEKKGYLGEYDWPNLKKRVAAKGDYKCLEDEGLNVLIHNCLEYGYQHHCINTNNCRGKANVTEDGFQHDTFILVKVRRFYSRLRSRSSL
jgi:hypothetical protein